MKLRYYALSAQSKHADDVRGILALSPEAVELDRIDEWVNRLGLEATWAAVRNG